MITENELRVGNWLLGCNGIPFQIDVYGILDIHNEESVRECLLPIPLTEEILLKSGFVDVGGKVWLIAPDIRFKILIESKSVAWSNLIIFGVYLKSVHQLQNLYWCLTGEELNITLD